MQADLLFTAYNCVSDADLKIASLTSPHCSLWSPQATKKYALAVCATCTNEMSDALFAPASS